MSLLLRLMGLGGHAPINPKSYRLPAAKATVVAISGTKVSIKLNATVHLAESALEQAQDHFDCIGHMKAEVTQDIVGALHEWAAQRNCVAMCRHSNEQLYLLRDYMAKRLKPCGITIGSFTIETRCHVGHSHCEKHPKTI